MVDIYACVANPNSDAAHCVRPWLIQLTVRSQHAGRLVLVTSET